MKDLGIVYNYKRSQDESKKLIDYRFEAGDFIDIAVYENGNEGNNQPQSLAPPRTTMNSHERGFRETTRNRPYDRRDNKYRAETSRSFESRAAADRREDYSRDKPTFRPRGPRDSGRSRREY